MSGSVTEQRSEAEATPLFLVLEGGGAKGIAHVAFWKALEESFERARKPEFSRLQSGSSRRQYKITDIAGTSAGALAGALIAAGASASDLLDDDGYMPLARELGIQYFHDLFGVKGWRRLRFIRTLFEKDPGHIEKLNARFGPEGTGFKRGGELAGALVFTALIGLAVITALSLSVRFAESIFDIGTHASVIFIFFCAMTWTVTALANKFLRHWERRAKENKRRHAPDYVTYLTHPFYCVLAGAAITLYLEKFFPFSGALVWVRDNSWPAFYDIVAYGVYGGCIGLVIYSTVRYIRGWLKGIIRTGDLRDDINTALVMIVTQKAIRRESGRYRWERKEVNSEKERALHDRLSQPDYFVTFGDLYEATGINLHIIAADVVGADVRVYSTAIDKDFSVAEAVASSIAIPFAFRFVRTHSTLLVDGGIVSTIPAWIFRRHRTLDPDARVMAVGIPSTHFETWIPHFLKMRDEAFQRGVSSLRIAFSEPLISLLWPMRFLANIAYTTAYGGRALDLDASDRLDIIHLTTGFGLLDFDKSLDDVTKEVEKLQEPASFQIYDHLWGRQEIFEEICLEIEEKLWQQALEAGNDLKKGGGRVRFLWADCQSGSRSLRAKRCFRFKGDELDDRVVLPFDSSLAGLSAANNLPYFAGRNVMEDMLRGRMNRYRRFVRWNDMEWCWTIPVSDRGGLRNVGVLIVQCNRRYGYFGAEFAEEAYSRDAEWVDSQTGWVRLSGENIAAPPPRPPRKNSVMEPMEQLWAYNIQNRLLSLAYDKADFDEGPLDEARA